MPPKRPAWPEATGAAKKRARMNEQRTINVQRAAPGGSAARGNDGLPPTVVVEKFAEARVFEINSLQAAMRSAKAAGTIRAFQSLPRSLRRRAASHNIRRLPSRLRAKALTETPEGAAKPKKKTRKMIGRKLKNRLKYSRKDLLLRRQANKIWLETHIWHAKRMHMKNVWGHRLAEKPTEKAFRSSYRASFNGALVHDASYFQYLELKGTEDDIKVLLSQVCDKFAISPSSKRYSTGARECPTHLFTPMNPMAHQTLARLGGLIGPATIIWDTAAPSSDVDPPSAAPVRQVLVRLHPAICSAGHAAFAAVLARNSNCAVILVKWEKEFLTFEVTGRRATEVVKAVLQPTPGCSSAVKEAWKNLSSIAGPGSVPRDMVFGLEVYDPRLSFPPKLDKSAPPTSTSSALQPSAQVARVPSFWNPEARSAIRSPKFRKTDLDARRSQLLIPGTPLPALAQDNRIPVLVTQRTLSLPSSPDTALTGWTLTIPAGWGIPFLSSLVFSQSRPGGLLQRSQQAFEAGVARFPEDYPGTKAFEEYETEREREDKGYWLRRPPAKRENFAKLGTESPWRAGLEVIASRWSPEGVPVERGWIVPVEVTEELVRRMGEGAEGKCKAEVGEAVKALRQQRRTTAEVKAEKAKGGKRRPVEKWNLASGLVRVRITPCGRGAPEELGVLYWLGDVERGEVEAKMVKEGKRVPLATGESEAGAELCSPLPTRNAAIGRVTTGNFSLKQGHGAAVGAIPLVVWLNLVERDAASNPKIERLVAVRNRGGEVFRAVTLELM